MGQSPQKYDKPTFEKYDIQKVPQGVSLIYKILVQQIVQSGETCVKLDIKGRHAYSVASTIRPKLPQGWKCIVKNDEVFVYKEEKGKGGG